MRRTVFTQPDRIMCIYVDDMLLHHACESHRRTHIIAEDQECCAVRDDSAVKRHSVHDTAHAVFADAEMEVAAIVMPRLEAVSSLHNRVSRWREISGAANQFRYFLSNCIDHCP